MTAGPSTRTHRSRSRLVVVRDLTPADLAATAALQAAAPEPARLAAPCGLGPAFLRRWQQAHLTSPHAVALVAEQADDASDDAPDDAGRSGARVRGLLLGVTDRRAHREHLLRHHGLDLARAGAAASLDGPRVVQRWARVRSGPLVSAVTLLPTRGAAAAAARRAQDAVTDVRTTVLVDAVVVDSAVRGTGVGRQLLRTLAARAASTGAERVEARVPWGSGAEGFFAACGWTASSTRPSPRGGFETPFHLDL